MSSLTPEQIQAQRLRDEARQVKTLMKELNYNLGSRYYLFPNRLSKKIHRSALYLLVPLLIYKCLLWLHGVKLESDWLIFSYNVAKNLRNKLIKQFISSHPRLDYQDAIDYLFWFLLIYLIGYLCYRQYFFNPRTGKKKDITIIQQFFMRNNWGATSSRYDPLLSANVLNVNRLPPKVQSRTKSQTVFDVSGCSPNVEAIKSNLSSLSAVLNADVQVVQSGSVYKFLVARDRTVSYANLPSFPRGSGKICLGINLMDQPVIWERNAATALDIRAASGYGKTVALHLVLRQLLHDEQRPIRGFIILKDINGDKECPPDLKKMILDRGIHLMSAFDPDTAPSLGTFLDATEEYYGECVAEGSAAECCLLVIDEAHVFLPKKVSKEDKESLDPIIKDVNRWAAVYRSVKWPIIISTQLMDAEALAVKTTNFPVRLLGKCDSPALSRVHIGSEALAKIALLNFYYKIPSMQYDLEGNKLPRDLQDYESCSFLKVPFSPDINNLPSHLRLLPPVVDPTQAPLQVVRIAPAVDSEPATALTVHPATLAAQAAPKLTEPRVVVASSKLIQVMPATETFNRQSEAPSTQPSRAYSSASEWIANIPAEIKSALFKQMNADRKRQARQKEKEEIDELRKTAKSKPGSL